MYRKIALVVTIIGFAMIHGCAELDQLQVKRGVKGNVFYSSSPGIELRIDSEIRHMATVEEERAPERSSFENDLLENTTRYTSYIFGDAAAMTKGVIIRTRTVTGNPNQVFEPLLPERGHELATGMTKILGDEYRYYAVASDNLLTEKEQRALSGRNISGCLLVKGLERGFALGNKSLLQILYFERIEDFDCNSWQDPKALTGEQESLLGAFLDRSYQEIRFMKGEEVVDATAKYVDSDQKKDAAVETPPPPAAPLSGDIEKRLEILKNLRDKDLITAEEYENKKAEILEGL